MAGKARIYDYSEMRSNASSPSVDAENPQAPSEEENNDSRQGKRPSLAKRATKRPSVKKASKRSASSKERSETEDVESEKQRPSVRARSSADVSESDVKRSNAKKANSSEPSTRGTRKNRDQKRRQERSSRPNSDRSSSRSQNDSSRSSSSRPSRTTPRQERPKDLADQVLMAWRAIVDRMQGFLDRPHGKSFYVVTAGVICVVLAAVFLYPSVQNYYIAVRETAKSQAEYDALQEYYERIKDEAAAAQTDTGVEDLAHKELGLVMEGDNAINVLGVEPEGLDLTDIGIVPEGSVKAPDTWYSGFLDPFFGYDG